MTMWGATPVARCIMALAVVVSTVASPPGVAVAQDSGDCDDLTAQIASVNADLDQLRLDTKPWLVNASQLSALVTSDLLVAAQHGAAGLTPDSAASFGAIALQIGAAIDSWRAAHQNASAD